MVGDPGKYVGLIVGLKVGYLVGNMEGVTVGEKIGFEVGSILELGAYVGYIVGDSIGLFVGAFEIGRIVDGLNVDIGTIVGAETGLDVLATAGVKIIGLVTLVAPEPDVVAKLHSIVTVPKAGIFNEATVFVYIW